MKSKLIAASAFHTSVKSKKHLKVILQNSFTQRGFTLIELMVGIVIGLLVVAAAMGSLMVSRSISGTVNDASNIQQQAAYAMRTIGLQLRQAGSLYLNLNPAETTAENSALAAVGFERKAGDFEAGKNIVRGIDAPTGAEFKLTTGYRNYKEALHGKTVDESQVRDCLGQQPSDTLIENNFVLKTSTNELYCAGSNKTAQPVVENVANFQVRYLVQESATAGDTKIKYATATAVGENWGWVQAVEVCLVLYGNESIDMPAGSSYTDCDGTTQIDMTTLTGARARRMHLTFRNVFQLRSQGLIGSVL